MFGEADDRASPYLPSEQEDKLESQQGLLVPYTTSPPVTVIIGHVMTSEFEYLYLIHLPHQLLLSLWWNSLPPDSFGIAMDGWGHSN